MRRLRFLPCLILNFPCQNDGLILSTLLTIKKRILNSHQELLGILFCFLSRAIQQ